MCVLTDCERVSTKMATILHFLLHWVLMQCDCVTNPFKKWCLFFQLSNWDWPVACFDGIQWKPCMLSLSLSLHPASGCVNEPRTAYWGVRGHVQERQTVPTEALLNQPAPSTWLLTTFTRVSPAKTRRTSQVSPARTADTENCIQINERSSSRYILGSGLLCRKNW